LGGILAICIGLGLVGVGAFLLLSFATADVFLDPAESSKRCWTGLIGAWLSFGGVNTLGRTPALALAALIVFWGLHVVKNARFLATWPQVLGGVMMVSSLSLGICAFANRYDMATGGLFAVYVSPPAILYFGPWGLALSAAVVLFLGILLAFGESAVFGIRGAAATVWRAILGFGATMGRLGHLLRMLFRPRFAVAGDAPVEGASAADRLEPRRAGKTAKKAAAASEADGDADGKQDEEIVDEKPTIRVWKPREAFASRYLDLDLHADEESRDDGDANAETVESAEAVAAGISPVQGEVPDAEGPEVVMDVDTEPEDDGEPAAAEGESVVEVCGDVVMPSEPESEEESEPEPAPEPVRRPAKAAEPRRAAPMREAPPRERPAAGGGEKDLARYELPSMALLDPPGPPPAADHEQIEACAKILEQTLAEFKIDGRVVHIERGPRVTLYELSLAPGIRLSKVTSLSDNLAMQLKAESVRIIAPIPGKDTIGIEIPNTEKELVSLVEIVASVNREKRRQALPICLGKDVSGASLVADLAKMPHLLIAGATGSGKSVCINSIIMSIMMCCRPDEAQLIMIDPKVVELSRFKDIPHLMSPVITDMKRAVAVLEWICQKMDERYEQMSQVSVNNIAKFNALGEDEIMKRLDAFAGAEEMAAFPRKMPYMVVIIDELADLMMVAGKEVEQHITRLAAKSRAVGIHLILATQRPSVDVITGLIKANMPCRIAFQVASRVDSRTILDQNGAEALLGQGDMLYLPPGVGKLARAQGVFVSDEELFRVVDFTKSEAEPQYHNDLIGPVIGGGGDVDISSFDELFLQAGEAIIESQRGSVSLLQRKFGIGYGRASRIIDQLASAGLLGPFRDGKAREILLSMEEFDDKFRSGSADSEYSAAGWEDEEEYGRADLRDDEQDRIEEEWA
jgi:S-DNA-T family DNA segregation ATPase FtsK/SpoIIIE